LAYTPLSFLYFRVLNSGFINDIGSHFSLVINLILSFLALAIPGIYIWKNQHSYRFISGKWVLLISLTSAPSLIMLDRGSSSFLLFPAVFFFYLGIQNLNLPLASWSIILMGIWKPQSLILAIGILIFFGFKPFLKTLFRFTVIFCTSFLLYPVGLFENISDYIKNSRDYQNYVPIPTPGNYSFINFIGFLKGIISYVTSGFADIQNAFRPPLDKGLVSLFCALYAASVILLFILARKSISKFQFILYSSVFMLTIAGTTFGYYLTLMLIPLIVLSRSEIVENVGQKGNRLIWILFCLFLFTSVPAWPLNWGNIPLGVGDSWSTLGVHWTLVHVIVSLLVIVSFYQLLLLSVSQVRKYRGKIHA
jgi:hypothetical protein